MRLIRSELSVWDLEGNVNEDGRRQKQIIRFIFNDLHSSKKNFAVTGNIGGPCRSLGPGELKFVLRCLVLRWRAHQGPNKEKTLRGLGKERQEQAGPTTRSFDFAGGVECGGSDGCAGQLRSGA